MGQQSSGLSFSEQRVRKLLTQFREPLSRISSSPTAKTRQSDVDGHNFVTTIGLLHHVISRLPSLNHIAAPSQMIPPFLEAFAQTHHSSGTDATDSIFSILHQNLAMPM
jgi:hypothetical protein